MSSTFNIIIQEWFTFFVVLCVCIGHTFNSLLESTKASVWTTDSTDLLDSHCCVCVCFSFGVFKPWLPDSFNVKLGLWNSIWSPRVISIFIGTNTRREKKKMLCIRAPTEGLKAFFFLLSKIYSIRYGFSTGSNWKNSVTYENIVQLYSI